MNVITDLRNMREGSARSYVELGQALDALNALWNRTPVPDRGPIETVIDLVESARHHGPQHALNVTGGIPPELGR